MARKVMISCAVTGSADTPGRNPAVPVTPEQIANSCLDAAKAGAAIVHIHVRDPKTTKPSMDKALYRESVERIREKNSDVIINLTTGPGARFWHDPQDPTKPSADSVLRGPAERVQHVMELKPEICSLDMGSLNMGDRVFINTPTHLKAMAQSIKDAGVTPELEVFETGHLLLAKKFLEDGLVKGPGLFQICLGISWGQPATPEAMAVITTPAPHPSDEAAFRAHSYKNAVTIGSPAYPPDEAYIHQRALSDAARAYDPAGVARQYAAVIANGDRRPKLAKIKAPTVVFHGADDPLVPLSGGKDTAAHIPGAEMIVVPGMGHDLPPQLFDQVTQAIVAVRDRARAAA